MKTCFSGFGQKLRSETVLAVSSTDFEKGSKKGPKRPCPPGSPQVPFFRDFSWFLEILFIYIIILSLFNLLLYLYLIYLYLFYYLLKSILSNLSNFVENRRFLGTWLGTHILPVGAQNGPFYSIYGTELPYRASLFSGGPEFGVFWTFLWFFRIFQDSIILRNL